MPLQEVANQEPEGIPDRLSKRRRLEDRPMSYQPSNQVTDSHMQVDEPVVSGSGLPGSSNYGSTWGKLRHYAPAIRCSSLHSSMQGLPARSQAGRGSAAATSGDRRVGLPAALPEPNRRPNPSHTHNRPYSTAYQEAWSTVIPTGAAISSPASATGAWSYGAS